MADKKGAALVTGAARRMGRAIALGLAEAGYDVAVHYRRSRAEAEAVVREIRALGRRSDALAADLARESETAALVSRAAGAVGPLALLVNSASAFEADDIDTMTRATWDLHIETNLRAPLRLIQDFARAARADANPSVINILDQRVLKPTPRFLSYAASKAALHALTAMLAQALAPRGVRINAIGPGPTFKNARQSEEDFRAQAAATLLRRGADPQDIVGAVLYLAGAAAVTGQMIAVDGGQHLAWRTADAAGNE